MSRVSSAQEDSAYCAACARQVLVRRLRRATGWGPWLCTVCGREARPDAEPYPRFFVLMGAITMIVIVGGIIALIVMAIHG
jgi:hypothetical protein